MNPRKFIIRETALLGAGELAAQAVVFFLVPVVEHIYIEVPHKT